MYINEYGDPKLILLAPMIQKFREGIDLWFLIHFFMLNALYHVKVHMKTRESRLQNGIFVYKRGISLTKQESHLQNALWHL